MSISSILTSITSQVSTSLGGTWSELEYIYNLEANNTKNIEKRYGVGTLNGASVGGTTKAITVDFDFFIVLTKNFVNRSSDENQRTLLSEIYDEFETINQNIFQKKLNNANILLVSDLSYDEPEIINDNGISVKVNFTIKYRNPTT
jgi:hypothetical protein